jgi:hypothetical protein
MEKIKEAFQKIKEDMDELKSVLKEYGNSIIFLNEQIQELKDQINSPTRKGVESGKSGTFSDTSAHFPTHNSLFRALKDKIPEFSTGNGGVPTDRQTDRQTDRHINSGTVFQQKNTEFFIENALNVLNSLDSVKKEVRLKFKRLTDQEWKVFATIYTLDEQVGYADYNTLMNELKLTGSSVRDYVSRLIHKGIPVEKHKINNKTITLRISDNLKKIAPLTTISQLRGV